MSEHPFVGELGVDPATYDDVEQVVAEDENNDDPNYDVANDHRDGTEPELGEFGSGPFSGEDPAR